MARAVLLLLAGLLPLAAGGCSGGGVAPVSGVVTMDGKPLAGARVQFAPAGPNPNPGSGSYAQTGPDGRYELRQVDPDRSGAVVGPHTVRITTVFESRGDGAAPPKDPIPERYNERTELTFEVPAGGSTAADFPLRSTPR